MGHSGEMQGDTRRSLEAVRDPYVRPSRVQSVSSSVSRSPAAQSFFCPMSVLYASLVITSYCEYLRAEAELDGAVARGWPVGGQSVATVRLDEGLPTGEGAAGGRGL